MQRIVILLVLILGFIPLQIYGQFEISDDTTLVTDQDYRHSLSELRFGPLFSESGVSISYSYIFQKSKMLGLGGSLDWSRYSFDQPYTFLVASVKYKGYFASGNIAPFIQSSIGYGLPVSTKVVADFKANGGVAAELGTGIRIGKRKPQLELGLSFRVQKGYFEYHGFGSFVKEDITFKRLLVSLGFLF